MTQSKAGEHIEVTSPEDLALLPVGTLSVKARGDCDRYLLGLQQFRTVRTLDLSACADVSDEGLRALRGLDIEELVLAGCESITDVGVSYVSELPRLAALDLSLCNLVTDDGVSRLVGLSRLRSVDLSWCYSLTDAGLFALSKLENLRMIRVRGCENLTDVGLTKLARLPLLERLELPELAPLTDTTLESLGAFARNLRIIRIAALKRISDTGIAHLARCGLLEKLTVRECNRLTISGLRSLSSMRSLRVLSIEACGGIKAEEAVSLGELMPHCEVLYS